MTSMQGAVEVHEATPADLRAAIRQALARAGCTLEELQEQARRGRYASDEARLAWFVISSVSDRLEAA